MRLIEGVVDTSAVFPDEHIADLQEEISKLQIELAQAKRETQTARRESARALGALRQQLNPLYRALQSVFGEIEAAGIGDDAPTPVNSRVAAVWEQWKQKMGGQAGQIIGALQLHNEMNAQQIAISIGIHKKNVPQLIYKLKQAGLINKNGDRYSLKAL